MTAAWMAEGREIPNEEPEPDPTDPELRNPTPPPELRVVEQEPGPMGPSTTPNLPGDFYDARSELAQARQAAHAARCSPDAVLGNVLAIVAALTPPSILLPDAVGTPGTLDYYAAIIGTPGTSKSASGRVARQHLPLTSDDVLEVGVGSGEGLIESYIGTVDEVDEQGKTRKVRRQVRTSVLARLDEGQALTEIGSRKSSILLPTLRSAWTGDQLGQHNASEERRRNIPAGEYRLALVANFQPEYATALLDDAAGGTPARFVFWSCTDPTMPKVRPPKPAPSLWRPPRHQAGPMDLAGSVYREIDEQALAVQRGERRLDALDAHRNLSRLKVAGLLALLAGRLDIDAEDWQLAGVVLDASDRVRTSIQASAAAVARLQEHRATERMVQRTLRVEQSTDDRALDVMARAVARHVHKAACPGGCRRRCLSRSTPSKYRSAVTVDQAIEEAEARGWIVSEHDAFLPGAGRPA